MDRCIETRARTGPAAQELILELDGGTWLLLENPERASGAIVVRRFSGRRQVGRHFQQNRQDGQAAAIPAVVLRPCPQYPQRRRGPRRKSPSEVPMVDVDNQAAAGGRP